MAKEPAASPAPLAAELIAPAAGLDIKEIARLGAEASAISIGQLTTDGKLGLPASIPVAIVNGKQPELRSVQRLLEEYRLFPERKSGQAVAQTFASFVELVNRHKTADSVVFADMDWKKPSLTAVIDYHQAASGGKAAFGRHRVHYAFPLSEEWQAWIALNGEKMGQENFAHFIEDHVAELSSPTEAEIVEFERQFATRVATPSQLVELSRGLQVNIAARVKNVTTLQSGEGQIAWEESHQDADGKPLKVPGMFILNMAPFFMGDQVRIPVRLRYRPSGASIVWFYQIYRPDQAITQHVRDVLAEAREKTELPAYEGTPEMPL